MKKLTITLVVLFSLSLKLLAEDNVGAVPVDPLWSNLREGKSSLISSLKEEEVRREYQGNPDLKVLQSIMADRSINRCATKIIRQFKQELDLSAERDVELAILGLRLYDSLDDVSAGLLLKANDLSHTLAVPLTKDDLSPEEENAAMAIYKELAPLFKKQDSCPEDVYRDLFAKLRSESPKFVGQLKRIHKLARNNGFLSDEDYKMVEVFRMKKVHEWPLTMSSYARSLEKLTQKYPDRTKEKSDAISSTKFGQKISMRVGLYQKFNSTQIILLANLVKEMKARLESKDVKIVIDYDDRPAETIELSPMEKFRFILKLLRKEMAELNNSSLLEGKNASYFDVIAAAYEVGVIKSGEIEQLAALQEIWNPTKTPKEKALFWVKTFGGVASVLLPPPYGFVSVMAIMLIDQQVKDAPVNRDPDFNLF